jgi:plasmid stabilization system protein ParE
MAYKISWNKAAKKQFDEIVQYIENEWSEKSASKFVNRSNEIFELLSIYPDAGSVEIKSMNIRGFLISRQVRLFYEVKKSEIVLLNFFDTRLNPGKKLKKYSKWKQ